MSDFGVFELKPQVFINCSWPAVDFDIFNYQQSRNDSTSAGKLFYNRT